jgi:hypothetical protein
VQSGQLLDGLPAIDALGDYVEPSVGERIRAKPARTIAWSSTSATRIIA